MFSLEDQEAMRTNWTRSAATQDIRGDRDRPMGPLVIAGMGTFSGGGPFNGMHPPLPALFGEVVFPSITAFNMWDIDYSGIVHSHAHYEDGQHEGVAFMRAAHAWLRGPKQKYP